MLNGVKSSGYDPTVENALRADPDFGPVPLVNEEYSMYPKFLKQMLDTQDLPQTNKAKVGVSLRELHQ